MYTYTDSPGNVQAGTLAGPYQKTVETALFASGYLDNHVYFADSGKYWFEGDYLGDRCKKTSYVTSTKEQWRWRPKYEITIYYSYTDWSPWNGWYEYDGLLVEPNARTQVEMKVE